MHVCSAPLTLSDWRLGALTVDTFDQRLVHLSDYCCTELPKACNYEWDLWLGASSGSSAPPPEGHFTTNIFFAELTSYCHGRKGVRHRRLQLRWWLLPVLPPAPPRGPAIDISYSGGGRCRTCRQQPPGGPPLMSPNSVVTATGPVDSIPQEARHRHLQLRWWSLPDLPPATPRGPAINVSNSGGGCCRTCRQHPPGGPPSTYR
jgi:hypothetical protein